MTAILYLDIDDEITSAVARIRATTDERVVFVLPIGSRLATSRINFRLLAREAATRGRRLEIVSSDPATRALVASAGLPAHPSVAVADGGSGPGDTAAGDTAAGVDRVADPTGTGEGRLRQPLRAGPPAEDGGGTDAAERPLRRPPAAGHAASPSAAIPSVGPAPRRSRRPLAVGIILTAFVASATGAAAVTFLPSADIQITPAVVEVGPLELRISAEPGVTEPDPSALVVPALRINLDLVAEQTFPATGIRVDEAAATGEVTFSSLDTGSANTIRAGSVVATADGIEFSTIADVVLPPAEVVARTDPPRFELQPSSVSVGVVAVVAGLDGNVAAGAISLVPVDENPARTTVTNAGPTSGGTHDEYPVIGQADVDAALAALDADLRRQFEARLADPATVPEGATLFLQTAELGDPVPSVDPATLVDQEIPEFRLGLAATAAVSTVARAPIDLLADARIRAEVPAGFTLDEASIRPEIGDPIVAGGTVTFPVTVRAIALHELDLDALRAQIRGRPLREARAILEAIGPARIELWPDWVTTIPSLDARLTITLVPPAGTGLRGGALSGSASR